MTDWLRVVMGKSNGNDEEAFLLPVGGEGEVSLIIKGDQPATIIPVCTAASSKKI